MAKRAQLVKKPKTHNHVYTGLLAAALMGMLIGCGLLFLDYRQYGDVKPPMPPLTAVR